MKLESFSRNISKIGLILFLGISLAAPNPTLTPSKVSTDTITETTTAPASPTSTNQILTTASISPPQIKSFNWTEDSNPNPAVIEYKNITETSIIIHAERAGKSGLIGNIKDNLQQESTSSTTTVLALTTSETSSNLTTTEVDVVAKPSNEGGRALEAIKDGDVALKKEAIQKPVEREEGKLKALTKPGPSEQDKMIQRIFGGQCTAAIWNYCSRIRNWGGDYLVPDKNNPGEMIVKHHKIRCRGEGEVTMCLQNGWTIARCHMLCMSQCNVDFRNNYDKLVAHEGDCRIITG